MALAVEAHLGDRYGEPAIHRQALAILRLVFVRAAYRMRQHHKAVGRNFLGGHTFLNLIEDKPHKDAAIENLIRLCQDRAQRCNRTMRVNVFDEELGLTFVGTVAGLIHFRGSRDNVCNLSLSVFAHLAFFPDEVVRPIKRSLKSVPGGADAIRTRRPCLFQRIAAATAADLPASSPSASTMTS